MGNLKQNKEVAEKSVGGLFDGEEFADQSIRETPIHAIIGIPAYAFGAHDASQ